MFKKIEDKIENFNRELPSLWKDGNARTKK